MKEHATLINIFLVHRAIPSCLNYHRKPSALLQHTRFVPLPGPLPLIFPQQEHPFFPDVGIALPSLIQLLCLISPPQTDLPWTSLSTATSPTTRVFQAVFKADTLAPLMGHALQ